NVVIFTDTYLPKVDGVGISVDHFTRILGGRGHNFVICAPRYSDHDPETISDHIHVIRFKNAPLPSYPDIKVVIPSHKKLTKAMTMFPPDLVHIQTPGLLGQYGVLAAKMYGVPMIGTYHTLVSEQDTYISLYRLLKVDTLLNYFKSHKKIEKRLDKIERKKKEKTLKSQLIYKLTLGLYQAGELIISPSHLIKKDLVEGGASIPIEVVSNGMDLDRFRGEIKEPRKPPKFLHVGRISFEKNCEVVLKAFALILEKIPDATLDIIGDGPALTSIKIEAKQIGVFDRCNFPGFVAHGSLHEIYPKYDLFLTASTMETQGLVVLEAMACGLPCVGVNAYALPELIQHERNGFVVEPFDHIHMAERALQLLGDPELYKKFSAQSLAIAGEHELNSCADRLESVYHSVVEKHRKKPAGLFGGLLPG
ncbi:MAG TPA: glycosyltransferase, partial [Leptospiraceae bacterium]|nr:glycosyltransferase [Leptospiraceae bacterium]